MRNIVKYPGIAIEHIVRAMLYEINRRLRYTEQGWSAWQQWRRQEWDWMMVVSLDNWIVWTPIRRY